MERKWKLTTLKAPVLFLLQLLPVTAGEGGLGKGLVCGQGASYATKSVYKLISSQSI